MRRPEPAVVGAAGGGGGSSGRASVTEAELASYPVDPHSNVDWSQGGTVLAFVNEVAGGGGCSRRFASGSTQGRTPWR